MAYTYDQLLKQDIVSAFEDNDNYYVKLKPDDYYDVSLWRVDKNTKKVFYADIIDLAEIFDKVKPIDLSELKRVL